MMYMDTISQVFQNVKRDGSEEFNRGGRGGTRSLDFPFREAPFLCGYILPQLTPMVQPL